MLALIKKDILLQKNTMWFGILYILVTMLAFAQMESSIVIVTIIAATYLFIQTPSGYDSRNNADVLINSLPVRRSVVVAAKYLTVPIYFLLSVGVYSMISLLVGLTGLPIRLQPLSGESIALVAVAVAFFAGVYHPVNFRWGYLRTRYVNIILFLGVMVLGSSFSAVAQELLLWVPPTALLFAAAVLILLASFGVSVQLYSRREF